MPELPPTPTTITAVVNGVPVEGVITHLSSRDVTVKMTKPHQGFTSGGHIPVMLGGHISFLRDNYGLQIAERQLQELYTNLMDEQANLPRVLQQYAVFKHTQSEIETAGLSEKDFAEMRMESRQAIREGRSTPLEHQEMLQEIGRSRRSTEAQVWALEERFMKEILGRDVSMEFTKQLLVYLEGLSKP